MANAQKLRERLGSVTEGATRRLHRRGSGAVRKGGTALPTLGSELADQEIVDLRRRRDQLNARVAELQFDLGGLVYEMAVRDQIRVDVIVRRAAALQNADAELGEVERILRLEETSTAGACKSCGAPHSSGAAYCWQCGQPILEQVSSAAIATPAAPASAVDQPN